MEDRRAMTGRIIQGYPDKGDTWPKMLKFNCETYGLQRAMRHKHFGIWQPYTWKDYYHQVKCLALGLLSLGFEPGDKVLIIGDNAPQWYYAQLAAQANHGISVGLYPDLSPAEIKTMAEHSEARFAIAEDQEQVDKFLQIKGGLPNLKKVVYWNYKGLAHYHDPLLTGLREILQYGEKYEQEHPGLFEQTIASGRADEVCSLIYTSGTTGDIPKGVVHTYRTMRAGVDHYLRIDPWTERDNIVPSLPPVWINEQWLSIGCHLQSACILNFAEAPETQRRDTRETNPSIVYYSARFWENQAALIQARLLDSSTVQRSVYRLLMPIGFAAAELRYKKEKPGLLQKTRHSLADLILFKPLRKSLGLLRARICHSSGAFLSPETLKFFHALDIPLKNIYSSTEGGMLTGPDHEDLRLETVGPVNSEVEIKIADQGEIVLRQPGVFLGYYKDPEKTAAVLQDGWFYSGDSGFIREDGHLVFVDRLKDLAELKSGDKLAPQSIEARLRSGPYIKDAWVLAGPEKAYASAVIIINYDTVSRWAGKRKVTFSTFTDLSQKPEIYNLVKEDIDRVNRTLPAGCRIKKYTNLHKEFSPEEGELTRNGKLKRFFLEERYHQLIEAIYEDKAEVLIETPVKTHDGWGGTIKTILSIQPGEGEI
jgi:long-chain acyl-CoA synthetase